MAAAANAAAAAAASAAAHCLFFQSTYPDFEIPIDELYWRLSCI